MSFFFAYKFCNDEIFISSILFQRCKYYIKCKRQKRSRRTCVDFISIKPTVSDISQLRIRITALEGYAAYRVFQCRKNSDAWKFSRRWKTYGVLLIHLFSQDSRGNSDIAIPKSPDVQCIKFNLVAYLACEVRYIFLLILERRMFSNEK